MTRFAPEFFAPLRSDIPASSANHSDRIGIIRFGVAPGLWRALFWSLCAIAAAGYFVQLFTRLRLTEDATIYLSIAHSAAKGKGFLFQGAPSKFPLGYPALIALLARAGLGRALYLNLLNLLALGCGILSVRSIAQSRNLGRERFCLIVLAFAFSFIVVKDAVLPLSDIVFFGVTITAVALAESAVKFSGYQAGFRWAASLAIAALSISIRLAGIAAVLALLFECWRIALRSRRSVRIAATAVFAIAAVAAAAIIVRWTTRPGTGAGTPVIDMIRVYTYKSPVTIVSGHFPDLGQLVLNIPQSILKGNIGLVFYPAGLLLLVAVGLAMGVSSKRWTPGKTFAIVYSLMILCAPYTPGGGSEPRYWLPVLPLFLAELTSLDIWTAALKRRNVRIGLVSYALYFVLAGIAALGYSDLVSVSKNAFLSSNMIAGWRTEYNAWLLHDESDVLQADPQILQILREYDGSQ